MKAWPRKFFYFSPCLLQQSPQAGSSLQLASRLGGNSGYQQTLARRRALSSQALRKRARANMPESHKRVLGQDRRGTRLINAAFLLSSKRRLAATGGARRAGGGVCAKAVARKEKLMRAEYNRSGIFPSKLTAARRWSVGTGLWARVRKQCLG